MRSGTQNVAGAVGLAVAAVLADAERDEAVARMRSLRDPSANESQPIQAPEATSEQGSPAAG